MARGEMAEGQDTQKKSEESAWDTIKVIIEAIIIAFVVRTFLFQPFNIPSPSMYPTLKVGDYLFVSKLSYGYSRYSFDFSLGPAKQPWISCCSFTFPGRHFWADDPKRGDVAVFKYPPDPRIDYIKRVIGLPGDRVQMREGVLYINGEAVKKERVEDYIDTERDAPGEGHAVAQYQETLPNGVAYRVLDLKVSDADSTGEYVVPEGHYFMMGDNRDNSTDSRFQGAVGYVPVENFVGRADIIFFSIDKDTPLWKIWAWPFKVRWSRFFILL